MTAPASGGMSPLKIAGIALIGVGVVAGVVGLTGLGGGGDESPQAAPPPASAEPAPGGNGAPPAPGEDGGPDGPGGADGATPGPGGEGTDGAAPGAPGTSPFTPGAPGTPGSPGYDGAGAAGAPPPPAAPAPAPAPGGAASEGTTATVRPAVRIYNNSTVRGLAEQAAGKFRSNGWTVSQVQNYSEGVIPTTTVYYRTGTAEKAAAEEIAREFGIRSEPRFDGIQDATPGVIVIVTRDFSAA
ncbi:LytR C-terminal domain-containing protein [Pseudonocardia sp. NPDC049635]|uniref:LytR C-terminal domain-containing protein n=1 Tax=Pseudonocardia sp. NPDC049635 TaxID=3155506 RepID=UPI0033F4553C